MRLVSILWWLTALWYCYDDALAGLLERPIVGHLHGILWLILLVALTVLAGHEKDGQAE